ncbi:MAG: HAD family hydrolase [Candidatus Aenigmatarchaeota archaeon]
MIKCLLFDADNTLYESSSAAKASDLEAMKFLSKLCGKDPEELLEEWKSIVNKLKESREPKLRHRKYSYSLLLKQNGFEEKLAEKIYEIFLENFLNKIKLFDGVRETLEELKEMGIKLVIVSEDFKEQLEKKIEKLNLKKFFDFILTCDDVGVMKPERKYYEIVKEKLGIPYEEMMAIGDSFEKDLEIPKLLGMKCVLVYGEDGRANFSTNDFREILNLLKSLNRKNN